VRVLALHSSRTESQFLVAHIVQADNLRGAGLRNPHPPAFRHCTGASLPWAPVMAVRKEFQLYASASGCPMQPFLPCINSLGNE